MPSRQPHTSDAEIAARALRHLQSVVAIDSQSDESSTTIPTTEGQRVLAEALSAFYSGLGATLHRDENANVIAAFPGRGAKSGATPVAFLIHMDTARGTQALPSLHVQPAWNGERVPYPKNTTIQVDLATYPAAAAFAGQDLVFGDGECPFGLDDKLGLTHLMTLATLLAEAPNIEHPPLFIIGRPDEEVGRDQAVVGLAGWLAERGVRHAYTVDGILPFEINVENFNAAGARVTFPDGEVTVEGIDLVARIGGVNTHGATAHAEGHRAGPRLVAEWAAACPSLTVVSFQSDALRDCDTVVGVRVAPGQEGAARAALAAVMAPHLPRGASWTLEAGAAGAPTAAAAAMIAWVRAFYASNPGFTLPCEDSSGRDGYTHPYRGVAVPGGLRLDLRVRDFEPAGLQARLDHIKSLAPNAETFGQYHNMGPRLAAHPELVAWAQAAARDVGIEAPVMPIRGGTGVDPFLDRGIAVANVGTGYFSPESEKEFTSLQLMARHAKWLFALVQRVGEP
ncbi:hypothetical protein LBMAG42_13580 [Deltaproteobacteria bacterium]|nr:hypothetical protein LBMAG42_13580 [Deltaproteobacteria bacterium]